jgi:hypothetical protein
VVTEDMTTIIMYTTMKNLVSNDQDGKEKATFVDTLMYVRIT